MNNEKISVLEWLSAFSSKPNASFYEIAMAQIENDRERLAFRYGALAVAAGSEGKRIRSKYYERQFIRLARELDLR